MSFLDILKIGAGKAANYGANKLYEAQEARDKAAGLSDDELERKLRNQSGSTMQKAAYMSEYKKRNGN